MKSLYRFALLLVALAIIVSTLSQPFGGMTLAQDRPARSREATPALRQQTFEIVWRTIKEKHFDPKFNGVDWDKVHEAYAPRIARVKSDAEFYQLLQEMLGELHQSHFVVLPPEMTHHTVTKDQPEGGIGVSIRIIDNQAVIRRLLPASSGERAGLKPGFVITAIDGETIEHLSASIAKRNESADARRSMLLDEFEEKLLGAPGSPVRLVYLDEADQAHELTLKRELPIGEMSPPVGNFPSLPLEFETKRLAGGIGYLRFSMFHPVLNQRIRAALRAMQDAPGIIIDLRGNPGGFDGVGQNLAGLLLDKQSVLGTSRMRSGYENYVVYPQKNPYAGPVVILLDGLSGSASESFSGGMQAIERVKVIGERSSGGDLDASIDTLPTGALLLYAYADFVTPKGVSLEGRGVIPDLEVKLTRASLLDHRDVQLEAAVNYLRNQSGQPK